MAHHKASHSHHHKMHDHLKEAHHHSKKHHHHLEKALKHAAHLKHEAKEHKLIGKLSKMHPSPKHHKK